MSCTVFNVIAYAFVLSGTFSVLEDISYINSLLNAHKMDEIDEMDEMEDLTYRVRNNFVLGANIREDMDLISRSERCIMENHPDFGGYAPFEDLQRRNEDFQTHYNYPAEGNKTRVSYFEQRLFFTCL